jgi:hypothetical protein
MNPKQFKVVRNPDEVGEWILEFQEREVGHIVVEKDDSTSARIVLGYWVTIDADSTECFIDTDGGSTAPRLAFRNAKEFAFEHLAKLLAEGVEL